MPDVVDDLVVIAEYVVPFEADLAVAQLGAAGIDAVTAYDGRPRSGGDGPHRHAKTNATIDLLVHRADRDAALDELRTSVDALPPEFAGPDVQAWADEVDHAVHRRRARTRREMIAVLVLLLAVVVVTLALTRTF